MKVAVICEGRTDFVILREVVNTLGNIERITLLQPPHDKLSGPGPGWQGVRRFLQTQGLGLNIGVHDLVVVHVDADVRNHPGVRAELVADENDPESLQPLCDLVKSWSSGGVSANVVVVLPREATDTWLLAAHSHLRRPESVEDPAGLLAEKGIIQSANGRPLKISAEYERLSIALVRDIERGSTDRLPELERFLGKLGAM